MGRLLPFLLLASLAAAEVARNGIVSAASPAIGIAPGSRFVIRGVGLSGPVRIGGREIPVIQQSKTLIEAWMPAEQDAGVHTLEVAGERRSITIVRSSTGLLSAVHANAQLQVRFTGTTPQDITFGNTTVPVQGTVPRERGIRELTVRIPTAAPKGCAVPVQAGISNFLRIAIGEPCPAPAFLPAFGESDGVVALVRFHSSARTFDEGWGVFARAKPALPFPPEGTCTAIAAGIDDEPWGEWADGVSVGPFIQVASGPVRRRLPPVRGVAGVYRAFLGGDDGMRPPTPLFFAPGDVLIESQRFRGVTRAPRAGPDARFPRNTSRRAGLEVVWTRAAGTVLIALMSKNSDAGLRGGCLCVAKAGQGRFRIPARALALLPADPHSEMFLARLDSDIWKRIGNNGAGAVNAAGIAVDYGLLELD